MNPFVREGTGEKDGSEKPAPAVAVEGDGHPSEAPIVLSDKREDHDAEEYDERAAKFWSVYVEEAESHDKALVETWKDDMEGIIIFVRFSVLLSPPVECSNLAAPSRLVYIRLV
jgi:hypothetical protein